jgi:hypothetical protein
VYDLSFLIDITQYLNELNNILQRTNQLISEIFAKITAFESKFWLWKLQLHSNNLAHFPTLKVKKPTDIMKYDEEIWILQQEIISRFQDFQKHEAAFSLLSESFDISVKTVKTLSWR